MISFWSYILFAIVIGVANTQKILFPTETSERIGTQSLGECFTSDVIRGQCINLVECKPLLDLLTKPGLTNSDRQYLRERKCGEINGDVFVCCAAPVDRVPPPVSTNNGASLLPRPGVCGAGSDDRIFGGNKTRIDEYPWMVLLNYAKPGNRNGFHCGGVLINNRYVLTASHCVNGRAIPKDWRLNKVRLGEWDLSSDRDCDELDPTDCADDPVDVNIEEFIPHEEYNPNSRNQLNDIALLRLARNVPYTDWIKPICLPLSSNLRSSTFEGINLDVSGWGKTENASRSDVKLKARVDGVTLDSCNEVYKRQNVKLENTQLCAGGEQGIDSCQGDSGGPLIGVDQSIPGRPYRYLAGVVSFGPVPCAQAGWPGVYTRVGSYIDWVERTIRP